MSLYTGEMSLDETVQFMMARANLPRPTAIAEVRRCASWPTQAAAYLTGCLEILAMRERHFARVGRADIAGASRLPRWAGVERRPPAPPRRARPRSRPAATGMSGSDGSRPVTVASLSACSPGISRELW